jgi:hypothetical protein
MAQSSCPHWGRQEAPSPLQIKATNWPSANKIDTCNGDLIVAITEVIAGNTIPTKNHLISLENVFGLNPKQLKITAEKDGSPLFLIHGRRTGEEEKEGP